MSVIAHLGIPADAFELGRILAVPGDNTLELETMVPLGGTAVPFFTLSNSGRDAFEETVRNHPTVNSLRIINAKDDRTLYALEWDASRDLVFEGFVETGAHVLSATATPSKWEFELRFPTHESLSAFQEHCTNAKVPLEVGRIYNPTKTDTGPWYGLTGPQRDALVAAVERGYYSIPRQLSTEDLAEDLGISDQAVSERLRRGIVTLVENTLVAHEEDFEPVG